MSLGDHLRELRRRVFISSAGIVAGAVIGWIYYEWVLARLSEPLMELREQRHGDGSVITLNFSGLTDSFATQVNVSIFTGVVLSSPVWLLQLWGFIVPGLTKRERRMAMGYLAAAVPLFLTGCLVAYVSLPKAVEVLLGFTPSGQSNIIHATDYINFTVKFVMAFGLAFLLPVLLVALNMAGVLPARTMLKGWRMAVLLIVVFSAVMTPTPDPWTMFFLAIPMIGLFFLAVGVSWLVDRRRAKRAPDWLSTPDEEASPL